MSAPSPVAEGTLASTPFAHLLMVLEQRKLTGTLAIWPETERPGQDRLLVRAGRIVAARLLEPSETLERSLLPLFRRTRAPYAFYEADLVGSGAGVQSEAIDTYALIAAGLRGGGRDEAQQQVLGAFEDDPVRIKAGLDAARFRLIPKETAVLDLLRAEPTSIGGLVSASGEEKVARRVLYLLAITGHLERLVEIPQVSAEALPFLEDHQIAEAKRAAEKQVTALPSSAGTPRPSRAAASRVGKRGLGAPEAAPAAPATLSSELRARWDDIAARVAATDDQTYFQVLGIDESATPEQVRNAYFELVKRVHPDRLAPELEPLRPFAERLFQLMTEAKENLEDPDKRIKYISIVRGGGGTPAADRRMMVIVQAAHELEKASVLANMGKWVEALHIVDDVKALDPSQLDAYALEAWALFHLLGQEAAATPEAIIALCDRVLEGSPEGHHERALYVKGLALKKLGKDETAVELFRRVAEKNPRHLDAAREVRLFEMRSRGGGKAPDKPADKPAAEGGGLLSKLFSSKKS